MKKDNLVNFSKYREKKMNKIEEEIKKKEEDANIKLFKELIDKPIIELSKEYQKIYGEIGVVCGFDFKEKHRVLIVTFREKLFLVNILNGGVFEYLGEIEDILDYFLYK